MTSLLIERPREGVALLTFNRPDVLNAIDMELAARLKDALAALAEDGSVRAIVITGAGTAFSAGFDIHEMEGFDTQRMIDAFVERDPMIWQVASHPLPVIAALNGIAYGAGALIAAAADLRIGCPAMKFKVTATKYGAANATWTLPQIVGIPTAKEWLMTGRAVEADEALASGLVNRLVPAGVLVDTALDLAEAIASNPPGGVAQVKSLINGGIGRAWAEQFQAEHRSVLDGMTHAPGKEVFRDFLGQSKRGS
ncbi:MAG: enoyl-CoA hydratase/isomerase family protein [Sphingomonadales bacterium]